MIYEFLKVGKYGAMKIDSSPLTLIKVKPEILVSSFSVFTITFEGKTYTVDTLSDMVIVNKVTVTDEAETVKTLLSNYVFNEYAA